MDVKQVELNGPFSNHEVKTAGVPVLHYYSMGKSENIRQIASQLLELSPAVRYIFFNPKERVKRMLHYPQRISLKIDCTVLQIER
jgi:hypothetical protein